MKKRSSFLMAISFLILAGCATTSNKHTSTMNNAIELLKNEDYEGAAKAINSVDDKEWSYDLDKHEKHIDMPKDKILESIQIQKATIDAVRKECSKFKEALTNEEYGEDDIEKKAECFKKYSQAPWIVFLKENNPDILFDTYKTGELFKQPYGQKQPPIPFDLIVKNIIKNDMEQLKARDKQLRQQRDADYELQQEEIAKKQETKECKIIQAAFSICHMLTQINIHENALAHHKEIGKVSGVVNKSALYQTGNDIVVAKQLLTIGKNEFKKLTGINFNPSQCPKYYEADENPNSELAKRRVSICGKR